jgi:adenylate cyclase
MMQQPTLVRDAPAPDINPIRLRSIHQGRGAPVVEPDLTRWILREGHGMPSPIFLDELCWRIVGAGVKLWRTTVHVGTLHPQLLGFGARWRRDKNTVERFKVHRGVRETTDFQQSPIRRVIAEGATERIRPGSPRWDELPLLRDLRAQGATDYLATPLAFSHSRYQAATWASDAPGGFSDAQIETIDALLPALAAMVELRATAKMSELLLDTYLGHSVGPRVLAGQIQRGVGERLRAVILSSDLRGFTRMSDRLPGETVIELLDDYFERITEPVHAHGGDVLKFVGDGVLAIFPCDGDKQADAAAAAMAAATEALRRLAAWNSSCRAEKLPPLNAGIGLHLGDVIYGNVGAPDRLDFTAIGPAVNLASRLEGLTKRLGRPLLCSSAFAEAYPGSLVSLGFQPVRGLAEPEEIFAPEDGALA